MCNDKWNPLPDIEQVSNAKILGWEIQYYADGDWFPWTASSWVNCVKYRGRPKQPRTVTVTSECWRDTGGCLTWRDHNHPIRNGDWKRFPAGDITEEVKK